MEIAKIGTQVGNRSTLGLNDVVEMPMVWRIESAVPAEGRATRLIDRQPNNAAEFERRAGLGEGCAV